MKYTYEKLISFYKEIRLYDIKMFSEIEKRVKKLPNIINQKGYDFYGVFPKLNNNGVLVDFVVSIPEINDLDSFLVNIHEYAHAIYLVEMLGKVFESDYMDEVLPKSLEKIYLNTYEDIKTIEKYNKRDLITYEKTPSLNHKNAILLQFIVAQEYKKTGIINISFKQEFSKSNLNLETLKKYLPKN